MGLFDTQVARKPNNYPWTQEFIDAIWKGFWTPNEFDFVADYGEFHKEMTEQEQGVMVRTLSAIGQVEIAVKRHWAQLGDNLPHPSMYDLGYAMANTEVIHNLAYEKLLDVLKLQDVFKKNLEEPVFKGRFDYLSKHLSDFKADDRKLYIYRTILFTLFVENVSLFSQFYTILWFNRFKNILKHTAQQVQYTRNEEMLHAQIGIKIINTLRKEYPELFDRELEDRIIQECHVAFNAEAQIIDWMIGDYNEKKLNATVLKEYAKDRFNQSMTQIGYKPQFITDSIILKDAYWMDEETLGNNMTDFFHKRPVEYSKKSKVYSRKDLF